MSELQSLKSAMSGPALTEDQRATMRQVLELVPGDFRESLRGVPETYQHAILLAWGAHQLKWQKLGKRWACTPAEAERRSRVRWERIAAERLAAEAARWRESQAAREKPNTRGPQW